MSRKTIADIQMEDFIKLHTSIEKSISFNRIWNGPNGSVRGVVDHVDRRIIMAQGEIVKFVDNYHRIVVLIGSHFGTIAIYPSHMQTQAMRAMTLTYDIPPALAFALGHKNDKSIKTTGLLKDDPLFELDPAKIWEQLDELATYCRERFLHVGDGIPKPKTTSSKRKHVVRDPKKQQGKPQAAKPKQASAKPQPPKLPKAKVVPENKIGKAIAIATERTAADAAAVANPITQYQDIPAEFQGKEPMAA